MIKRQQVKKNYFKSNILKRQVDLILQQQSISRPLTKQFNQSPCVFEQRNVSTPQTNKPTETNSTDTHTNKSYLLKQIMGRIKSNSSTLSSQYNDIKRQGNKSLNTPPFSLTGHQKAFVHLPKQSPNSLVCQQNKKKQTVKIDTSLNNDKRSTISTPVQQKTQHQTDQNAQHIRLLTQNSAQEDQKDLSSRYGRISLRTLQDATRRAKQQKFVDTRDLIRSKYLQIDQLMDHDKSMLAQLVENCRLRMQLQSNIIQEFQRKLSPQTPQQNLKLAHRDVFTPLKLNFSLISTETDRQPLLLMSSKIVKVVTNSRSDENKENESQQIQTIT